MDAYNFVAITIKLDSWASTVPETTLFGPADSMGPQPSTTVLFKMRPQLTKINKACSPECFMFKKY